MHLAPTRTHRVEPTPPETSGGFTLIELTVGMTVFGALLALGTPAWRNYQANQEDASAAQEVVSVLRNAQLRSTSEATTYRVDVDAAAKLLRTYRYDGTTPVLRSTNRLEGQRVVISAVAFPAPSPTSVFFFARGTASDGHVHLRRPDRTLVKKIDVEGLTGRVSLR